MQPKEQQPVSAAVKQLPQRNKVKVNTVAKCSSLNKEWNSLSLFSFLNNCDGGSKIQINVAPISDWKRLV